LPGILPVDRLLLTNEVTDRGGGWNPDHDKGRCTICRFHEFCAVSSRSVPRSGRDSRKNAVGIVGEDGLRHFEHVPVRRGLVLSAAARSLIPAHHVSNH
jgi:hypothetical protein